MELFSRYPNGSDITILNTMYIRPHKDEKGKWTNDTIILVARDNVTGKKIIEEIDTPKMQFYKVKDGITIGDYNHCWIEKDKVELVECNYKDLERAMAEATGNLDFFYDNIKAGDRKLNKALFANKNLFRCDLNICDFYRYKFANTYMNREYPLKKAFLDIEVNALKYPGDFCNDGSCPINAVSIFDDTCATVNTYILEEKDNPLIQEFKDNLNKDMFNELQQLIIDNVGIENSKKYGIDNLRFNMYFYQPEEEIDMIYDIFQYINSNEFDFVLAWNMGFDIPYFIERIKVLGYNPEDIMCDTRFKNKLAYYVKSKNGFGEYIDQPSEKSDYAVISSTCIFTDQLIHFASRRKNSSNYPDYKLDTIGQIEANVNKLDYHDLTYNLLELPYKSFKRFIFYNVFDVIVQKCIEFVSEDMEYIFSKALYNNNRIEKIHKQTGYLTNKLAESLENDQGLILGNNVNRLTRRKNTKYPGAYVSNPLLNGDFSRVRTLNGIPILMFRNVVDFDYTRLYPSEDQNFNICPTTFIGKINIPEQINPEENRYNDNMFSRDGYYIEDITSNHPVMFANRWFKLANHKEILEDMREYFTHVSYPALGPKALNSKIWFKGKDAVQNNIAYTDNREFNYVEQNQELNDKIYNQISNYDELYILNTNHAISVNAEDEDEDTDELIKQMVTGNNSNTNGMVLYSGKLADKFLKKLKKINTDGIYICDNYMIGVNFANDFLRVLYHKGEPTGSILDGHIIYKKELNAFLRYSKPSADFKGDRVLLMTNDSLFFQDCPNVRLGLYTNPIVFKRMKEYIWKNDCLFLMYDDITNDEQIIRCNNTNADYGGLPFVYGDKYMTIHKNLFCMNKGDKLTMSIADGENDQFTVRFITEKKEFDLVTYIKYIRV